MHKTNQNDCASVIARVIKDGTRDLGNRDLFKKFASLRHRLFTSVGAHSFRLLRIWDVNGNNAECFHVKTIRKHQSFLMLVSGNWNITLLSENEDKLVEETKRYWLDIVGISSTKGCGCNAVELLDEWK